MNTINKVVPGFSKTNRWLLYANIMLAPAQAVSGIGSNCPSNLGFLAYNWYTQILWYRSSHQKQLHALSLLPTMFNVLLCFSYLGGVTSGNIFMGVLLGLGTVGVMILNTVSAWTSWATNLEEGYGVYQFFFFGWRTLGPGWRKLLLVTQIGDTVIAVVFSILALVAAVVVPYIKKFREDDDDESDNEESDKYDLIWLFKYPLVPIGAAIMLLVIWPIIMWAELIVHRNHIESDTDMIAVWLFVAQVVTMLIPSCSLGLKYTRS